jgi:hypothetical protein
MVFCKLALDAKDMHDREDACPGIIVGRSRSGIWEEAIDVWVATVVAGGGARADEAVDLACFEQFVEGLSLRSADDLDI